MLSVATGQRRHDERQELVTGIRSARRRAEVELLVHQFAEPEMGGQSGRQQQPCIGNEPVVVEGGSQAVEAVQ